MLAEIRVQSCTSGYCKTIYIPKVDADKDNETRETKNYEDKDHGDI